MTNINKLKFRKFGKITVVVTKYNPNDLKAMGMHDIKYAKIYGLTRSGAAALCYVRNVRGTMKTRVRVRNTGEFITMIDTACFPTAIRAAVRYLTMMGRNSK